MSHNPHPSKITAVIWRTQEAPDLPKDLIIYKLGDYDMKFDHHPGDQKTIVNRHEQ